MTGKQVLISMVVIALATAVLPPAAAYAVNQRRVSRAALDVRRVGEVLRVRAPRPPGAHVQCGPGRLPLAGSPAALPWVAGPHESLAAALEGGRAPSDPWGNCYLANDAWVVSAGPNGLVETAFAAQVTAGDDVGLRLF